MHAPGGSREKQALRHLATVLHPRTQVLSDQPHAEQCFYGWLACAAHACAGCTAPAGAADWTGCSQLAAHVCSSHPHIEATSMQASSASPFNVLSTQPEVALISTTPLILYMKDFLDAQTCKVRGPCIELGHDYWSRIQSAVSTCCLPLCGRRSSTWQSRSCRHLWSQQVFTQHDHVH